MKTGSLHFSTEAEDLATTNTQLSGQRMDLECAISVAVAQEGSFGVGRLGGKLRRDASAGGFGGES
ncbi:MAG: hypothetical protein Q8K82_01080, partial [Gemmatimonadaceae bacterium]|nr:hypothetical protein [Gemmatimonadaceae bacterium]